MLVFAGFDMDSTSLPMDKEDRLEGFSKFHVWNMRILNIFQEHDLLRFIETDPPKPKNVIDRSTFRRN